MTVKVRVYEVARELGLENRDLVAKMAAMGIAVRNHMSALEPVEVDRVKRMLERDKNESRVEERIRPTVVRRRTVGKPDDASAPETPPSVSAATPAPVVAKVASAPPTPPPSTIVRPDREPSDPPVAPVRARPAPEPEHSEPVVEEAEPTSARLAPAPLPTPSGDHQLFSADPASGSVRPLDNAKRVPAPASERLGHANLPPGVVARGSAVAPSAPPPSASTVSRIVNQHAVGGPGSIRPGAGGPGTSEPPRRRELGRAALGPVGRQQPSRPGFKKRGMPGPKRTGAPTPMSMPGAQKRIIRIEDNINLQMLAGRMSLKATDVLMRLMQLGMSGVNINSSLDADTAKILAQEFGYEVENVAKSDDTMLTEARGTFADTETDRVTRAPVVTIMGHVDHGKTSLLDRIRSANVAAGEAGGITQHIGAYRVETPRGPVVFLDTPGHEAFTAMRARGGHAADLVILVVAADDGVMPQTKEAISHARAAEVPIVVAMNKIDKPEARPDVVKRELANEGLQPEEWGGETMFYEVSAKSGLGVDKLLEGAVLQAEVLELNANPSIPAEGVVLEAYLDKGRGPVANILIQNGTLRTSDVIVAGSVWGKVRAMTDDRGKATTVAGPSTPVEVLGLSEIPAAGDSFYVVTDQRRAQEIVQTRKALTVSKTVGATRVGLDQIYNMMQQGEIQELRVVIKADMQGSIEAIVKALTDQSTEKVKVHVIHTGVGGITENDVMLASASKAIVIGFNVRPAGGAASTAKSEGVDVRLYSIIYEAVDEIRKAMAGLLAPSLVEKSLGKAEVRQVFNVAKVGTVAGCFVIEGKVVRSGKARLVRDSVQVWEGQISTLRRFKDDAKEVAQGYECGIMLAGYNDIKERDIIECYDIESVAAEL